MKVDDVGNARQDEIMDDGPKHSPNGGQEERISQWANHRLNGLTIRSSELWDHDGCGC